MNDLSKRLFNFGVKVIKYLRTIPETREYWALKNQLFRCCTSPGACYSESQGGCTLPDFHNKVNVSLKEMREANYWLRMILALRGSDSILIGLIRESEELLKILGSISYKTRKKS
jgi:four helix bundle protein